MREYFTGKEIANKQPQKKQISVEEMQLNSTYGVKQVVREQPNDIKNQENEQKAQEKASISTIKCNKFIIQKYIEDPLLIKGRKFDIRVWVLINQNLDCYFFKEGYVRTSSSEYNTDASALDDDYIHLTNNAIQKNSPNYA